MYIFLKGHLVRFDQCDCKMYHFLSADCHSEGV